tara:strand:+ start:4103 stop:4219 length:117 start_codon:yes stop_codon:yes gene_type:complete
MDDQSQHPLRILVFIGVLSTFIITLIALIQVFTGGLLG